MGKSCSGLATTYFMVSIIYTNMQTDKIALISQSREVFFDFVRKCNGNYRLVTPSLYLYKKIVEKHRKHGDLNILLQDNEFLELIYITLIAWDMNRRAAKLVSFEKFKKSIFDNTNLLSELYNYKLGSLSEGDVSIILNKIEKLFVNLNVMKSKSKIVGISKTLHFLLPDLIMPIDRKYTLGFFYGHNKYDQEITKEFKTFKEVFVAFHHIATKLKLSEADIDNFNWNTSIPKLIDNALIGFENSK
jgi:hypothetical protein